MIHERARSWMVLACLTASGCGVLRELPRSQYAEQPERRNVKVETRDGTRREFERIQVFADSLTGQQRMEVEGAFDEYETVRLGLDDVVRMSVRSVDWYRSGLLLGAATAVALAAILSQRKGAGDGQTGPVPCDPRDPACP